MSDARKLEKRGYPTGLESYKRGGPLSQPTEEIRVDGKTLSEAICETIESFDLGEIPDVLPVLEGFAFYDNLHRGALRLEVTSSNPAHRYAPLVKVPVSIVPTEGYRVIREEDFRIALYKALADRLPEEIVDDMEDPGPQSLVGPLHDDIMILMGGGTPVRKEWTEPRLTNTEDQP